MKTTSEISHPLISCLIISYQVNRGIATQLFPPYFILILLSDKAEAASQVSARMANQCQNHHYTSRGVKGHGLTQLNKHDNLSTWIVYSV